VSSRRNTRILIADDEPYVLQLLRDFLIGEGYDVTAVARGAEVLAAVPTVQPDVILLDMLMPGLSGRDVFEALRRASVTVPVILISGTEGIVREGFFAVVAKPFDLAKLAEVVAAAVDLGRTPRV
jgi:CheY-like chemotaxis protein